MIPESYVAVLGEVGAKDQPRGCPYSKLMLQPLVAIPWSHLDLLNAAFRFRQAGSAEETLAFTKEEETKHLVFGGPWYFPTSCLVKD